MFLDRITLSNAGLFNEIDLDLSGRRAQGYSSHPEVEATWPKAEWEGDAEDRGSFGSNFGAAAGVFERAAPDAWARDRWAAATGPQSPPNLPEHSVGRPAERPADRFPGRRSPPDPRGDWNEGLTGAATGRVTVLHGAGGTGKSLLLASMAATRPGHTQRCPAASFDPRAAVRCQWSLAQEEPERPHALTVSSGSPEGIEALGVDSVQRREQGLYDRKANQGGFAFLIVPAQRRFGNTPIYLGDPGRTLQAYEPRAGSIFLDPARADLTRPVKQVLAYASLGAAMSEYRRRHGSALAEAFPQPPPGGDWGAQHRSTYEEQYAVEYLDHALRFALSTLLRDQGFHYLGSDPAEFEPAFQSPGRSRLRFDQLPQQTRHLIAPVVLALHHFWTASRGADPRLVQGVVCLDDAELHLTEATQEFFLPRLRTVMPHAHWILATTSWRIAASAQSQEVIALRQQHSSGQIAPFQGQLSVTH